MGPDGHRGEEPGRKKLDPRSNSSRTLRRAEAGPAEGINTQTEEAGWSDPSITGCLQVCGVYCVCVWSSARLYVGVWEDGEETEKEGKERG